MCFSSCSHEAFPGQCNTLQGSTQSRLGSAFAVFNSQDLASKLNETASPICNSDSSLLFLLIILLRWRLFESSPSPLWCIPQRLSSVHKLERLLIVWGCSRHCVPVIHRAILLRIYRRLSTHCMLELVDIWRVH
jgi:hypothetical protein